MSEMVKFEKNLNSDFDNQIKRSSDRYFSFNAFKLSTEIL